MTSRSKKESRNQNGESTYIFVQSDGSFIPVSRIVDLENFFQTIDSMRETVNRKSGKGRDIQKLLPKMPAISATMAVLLMFMAINTNVLLVMKNLPSLVPLITSTILIFPILFILSYAISKRFFTSGQNIAITYSAGMKNLPIAIGIAAVSFGGMEMLPIAVAFAFQMLTAVAFYQIFNKKF